MPKEKPEDKKPADGGDSRFMYEDGDLILEPDADEPDADEPAEKESEPHREGKD